MPGNGTSVSVRTAQLRSARPPQRPTFVGRSAEIEQLLRMLGDAVPGEPQLAVIQGPPGIGKTRLAEEVGGRASHHGARFAIGACWPDGEAPLLWPWRAILRELGAHESVLEERGEAPADRFSRFQAALEALRQTSHRGPLVVVLDDAHIADPATLLLARFLARARGLPCCSCSRCAKEPRRARPRTCSRSCAATASCCRSTACPKRRWPTTRTPRARPGPMPSFLHAVAAVTGGNLPHLRSVAIQSELRAGVRGGLERAIGTLLERMDGADRRLIAVAALLGPEVSPLEVARVANEAPKAAAEALARAAAIGLGHDAGGGRFVFVHDLVRQTALAALPVAERLDLHARAAALLAGHEQAQLSRRVHHALSAASRSRKTRRRPCVSRAKRRRRCAPTAASSRRPRLLQRAAEIHAAAALPGAFAGLAVERAEAVLACGRLAGGAAALHAGGARVRARRRPGVAGAVPRWD